MDRIEAWLAQGRLQRSAAGRPRVSLCYAQSLDGSLTYQRGETYLLSGPEARVLTHRLRAAHAALLVGIGTVLADDPLLNVREVQGPNPIPIILDSRLRLPLNCRLIERQDRKPWVATTSRGDPQKRLALEAAGVRLLDCPQDDRGEVNLAALLTQLADAGVGSLMVEGGAGVITSFLVQGLADQAVVTIAPCFVGGLPVVESGAFAGRGFPRMPKMETMRLGEDIIAWGELEFDR
jgi:3,4-dihydroxy 2-butanone 4-phosphate synthase/GTP cyclohydrolase II